MSDAAAYLVFALSGTAIVGFAAWKACHSADRYWRGPAMVWMLILNLWISFAILSLAALMARGLS